MRVVFMGTPDFAVGTLKAIIEAGHDVAAVVTQMCIRDRFYHICMDGDDRK